MRFFSIWRVRVSGRNPNLQVPGLLHILPQHVVSQAVKHTSLNGGVGGPQAGFGQSAHQSIRVFTVELTQLCRATVRHPSCEAVSPVHLLLYGIVVELQVPHQGQDVASQTAQTLSEQEEAVGHPGQLQVLLGLRAADAAVEERQLDRGVGGHDDTSGWELAQCPGWRVRRKKLDE